MGATTRPPMTPYMRIIMKELQVPILEAYRIEQTIRDTPGCGTLDHLTREEIVTLAQRSRGV